MSLTRDNWLNGDDDPCDYCGEGDHVPAKGYWRCPRCDAEWDGEDEEDEQSSAKQAEGESSRDDQ